MFDPRVLSFGCEYISIVIWQVFYDYYVFIKILKKFLACYAIQFYHDRIVMERERDIIKNDFS